MSAKQERASCSDQLDLSVVVPVYRSEGCLEALIAAIEPPLVATGMSYEVVLVNDGSPDRSWQVIESLSRRHPNLVGIDLRRNFGQDNAILTGIQHAHGKVIAIMDDDLQHDPADIPKLVEKLVSEDADVVYANFRVKHQRLWKRFGSWINGKMAEWLIEKPKDIYLSPFKVIRDDIGKLICRYEGPDPYIDGFLFQVTSRITQVTVEHHERFAGTSNYTLGNSLGIWARHATAFSVKPLRMVILIGLLFATLGALLSVYVIAERLLYPDRFEHGGEGWASLMVAQLLTTAVRLVFLGILGEYAGRAYITLCGKPRSTIRVVLNSDPAPMGLVRASTVHSGAEE